MSRVRASWTGSLAVLTHDRVGQIEVTIPLHSTRHLLMESCTFAGNLEAT